MIGVAQNEVHEDSDDVAEGQILEIEAVRYLDAVETFRAEDCEPTWKLERTAA